MSVLDRLKTEQKLDVNEVADVCGASPVTVRRWLRDPAGLRSVKVGGRRFVFEKDLAEFIEGDQDGEGE